MFAFLRRWLCHLGWHDYTCTGRTDHAGKIWLDYTCSRCVATYTEEA